MTLIDTSTRRAASAQSTRHTSRTFLPACFALALFSGIALSGCGGPTLKPDVPDGVTLAGQWRLDRAESQDPQALLDEINQKFARRQMRRGGFDEDDPFGPGPAIPGTPGNSNGAQGNGPNRHGELNRRGGLANFVRTRYANALGERLGADGLTIEQSPDRFVIVRDGSRRSYTPGGHSVVSVEDGVADQVSGWKGREYMIDVRPQVGPHLNERFGLTADGKLIESVSLEEDGLPKLEFTRVYEKGEAPVRALPTSN